MNRLPYRLFVDLPRSLRTACHECGMQSVTVKAIHIQENRRSQARLEARVFEQTAALRRRRFDAAPGAYL